jgi:Uma2 family endonuclease
MASVVPEIHYPDSDGRPMAETPIHRDNLAYSVQTLDSWFADDPMVYVSGNMFVYYEKGNRHKHVAPDVFVVRGVPKVTTPRRGKYLIWEEGKGLDLAIEITSESTREEDLDDKFELYQDELKIPEYFLYDPCGEYLDPPLQGFRLEQGKYVRIEPVNGRLPSVVLGLHLEAGEEMLRFWDPVTGKHLLMPPEIHAAWQQEAEARRLAEAARQHETEARLQAEAARQQEAEARRLAEAARLQAEAARQQAEAARQQAEAELERLRQQLEASRQPPRQE